MQVLLLLLINSVSCYVNALHGMSRHPAKAQGSWDYSLNKDAVQTACNGVCVVPGRVTTGDNRVRMKSLLLCFCNADTSLSRLKELEAGLALPTPRLQKSGDSLTSCIFAHNNYGVWFWLPFIFWIDSTSFSNLLLPQGPELYFMKQKAKALLHAESRDPGKITNCISFW